jgi:hypothetical protein
LGGSRGGLVPDSFERGPEGLDRLLEVVELGSELLLELVDGLSAGRELRLGVSDTFRQGGPLGVEVLAKAGEQSKRVILVEEKLPAVIGENDVDSGFGFALASGERLGGGNLFEESFGSCPLNDFVTRFPARKQSCILAGTLEPMRGAVDGLAEGFEELTLDFLLVGNPGLAHGRLWNKEHP